MQINTKNGETVFKLLQVESRRIRDAVAIIRRAARNLDGVAGEGLAQAADVFDAFQYRWTSNSERLDREDQAVEGA
jgi:hypothetical protein